MGWSESGLSEAGGEGVEVRKRRKVNFDAFDIFRHQEHITQGRPGTCVRFVICMTIDALICLSNELFSLPWVALMMLKTSKAIVVRLWRCAEWKLKKLPVDYWGSWLREELLMRDVLCNCSCNCIKMNIKERSTWLTPETKIPMKYFWPPSG